MDIESEDESEKTFTNLTNVPIEPSLNYQLQFEQFVVAEKSDDESDSEDQGDSDQSSNDDEQEEREMEESFSAETEDLLRDLDISTSFQECTLKSEEVTIIENCHNTELKSLLVMNRSKYFMLMQLYKKIKDLLLDCRHNIECLSKSIHQKESVDNQAMVLTRLAAPYFKTKTKMFSSNPNKDTLERKQNGELSIYHNIMTPKWSRNECENLVSAVKLTYNHNKQKTLLRKISGLKYKIEIEDDSISGGIVEEIKILETEQNEVEQLGSEDVPPLGSDDYIDWEHIASEYLNGKHTALECRAFWHIYLHPEINKSNWIEEENTKIKELAKKYNQQDWDRIALELNTNRSGFSVCLHYLSALCEQGSKLRFTKEEDDLILYHVEKMRVGSYIPWNAIESYFPNRIRNQLVHRYKYFLKYNNHEQGVFSDAEDILISILVDRYGNNYSKFAHHLPHRSYMQIKNRYDNHLRISAIKGTFTVEEDEKLLKFMSSKRYMRLGSLCNEMNRTRPQLRQRYKTLKQFFDKNPGATISNAPRRTVRNDESARRYEFVKYMADLYKYEYDVPTLQDIEKRLGVTPPKVIQEKMGIISRKNMKRARNNPTYNVDLLLTNFFSHSYKLKQKPIDTTIHKIQDATETVFDILMKWKVNLEIPEDLQKATT
ncbi:hypothetical protein HHI36_019071 [Cryptolaemus montrouzieri]|uniref:snRNA-activating protein complex subunit 4 n=1 Tax=Cryptolaemus montrouzieri TaxID=559131 RepID=A0ABD2P226_9CUCU